jgi:hypothetical protein
MPAKLGFLGLSRLAKPLTGEEGRKILERDHYRCQSCGLDGMTSFENSLIMSVDFIQPRARQGRSQKMWSPLVGHVIGSKAVECLPILMKPRSTLSSAGRHYEVNGRLPWINSVVNPPKLRSLEIKQSDLGSIPGRNTARNTPLISRTFR